MKSPPIRLSIDELEGRAENIKKIISILTVKTPGWKRPASQSTNMFAFGFHDGSPSGNNVSEWLFQTKYKLVAAQYYEIWHKKEKTHQSFWYLSQACLNIFEIDQDSRTPKEAILLHSEPAYVPDESLKHTNKLGYEKMKKQAPYKKLLHLHFSKAGEFFKHCHIALHIGYDAQVLSSAKTLSIALQHSIKMLKEEVLDASYELKNPN